MVKNWRNSKKYKIWRALCIKLTPYCTICDKRINLHVHHLEDASSNPLQRYNPLNAKVMCRKCHRDFHIYYKQGYRAPCNKKDYEYFKKLIKSRDKHVT